MTMIKKILKHLAVRYLGLVEKRSQIEETAPVVIQANMDLVAEKNKLAVYLEDAKTQIVAYRHKISEMEQKYPTIWLQGHVAQGVMQLPGQKIAVEFYREENRLCVFIPWKNAEGKPPASFVPPWLEVDEQQQITSIMDTMNGNGIVFKIPIKGWDDTIELTRKVEDDHPSYGMDGRLVEKTRSFRSPAGVNGTFRREITKEGALFINIWYMEADLPNHTVFHLRTADKYFPKGNLKVKEEPWTFRAYGSPPDRIWHWRFPAEEIDVPKLGYRKTKALPSSTDAGR